MTLNPSEPPSAPVPSAPPVPRTGGAPPAPAPPAEESAPPAEMELWWGAYSGWTMLPSFLVCLLLTGLIGWLAWWYVPAEWLKVTALSGSGVVWLIQLTRWARRVFGLNYRLTTRHLWLVRGPRLTAAVAHELSAVEDVTVERTWLERRLGVGRVRLRLRDGWPVVLEGVRQPYEAARVIREAINQAWAAKR